MNEKVQELVKFQDRFSQIYEETRSNGSTITAAMKYFAAQIEMAYIAGANGVKISSGIKPITDTGVILVNARNYVKDKGYDK